MQNIVLKHPKTGEMKTFQLTRAGIYLALLFLADNSDVQDYCALRRLLEEYETSWEAHLSKPIPFKTILQTYFCMFISNYVNTANVVFVYNELQEKMNAWWRGWSNYLTSTTDIPSDTITNIHWVSVVRNYLPVEDVFFLNGNPYPKSWKQFLRTCEDCGRVYLDQNALLNYGIRRGIVGSVSIGDLGIYGNCADCVCDFRRCDNCGLWEDDCDMYYIENTSEYLCQSCLESGDYRQCDQCGNWYDVDECDDSVYTDDDRWFCSAYCAESYGYHWSNYHECWTQDADEEEIDDIIVRYHHYPVSFTPVIKGKRKYKYPHCIGFELEVDEQNRYDYDVSYFEEVLKLLGDNCFFMQDGSLDGGFETISMPLNEQALFTFDWEKAFSKLRDDGWRSHYTNTCGLHFHFSSWFLGYTKNQKKDSAKKLYYFFNRYWNDLAKFSRRKDFGYCKRMTSEIDDERWEYLTNEYNARYYAVNCTNLGSDKKDTIEIRICKGTLNTETFLASADFFLHLVRNAKSVPWKEIDNLDLWFKGIKKENTINYIKSRGCFEGAF